MKSSPWRIIGWCGVVLASASFALWLVAMAFPFVSIPAFIASGRPFALSRGFLYFDVSPTFSATEQAAADHVRDLADKERRGVIPRFANSSNNFNSHGSGDRMIFWGHGRETQHTTLGTTTALVKNRVGLWVSPWAGVFLGLLLILPWAIARWLRPRRFGDAIIPCENCGYDLVKSPLRCPECGTPRANTPSKAHFLQ